MQAVRVGEVDEDVHRALGVTAGRLADDTGEDLLRPRQLEIEQAKRTGRVQPVDVVLDVFGRVLAAHQPGRGVLELTAVHHDWRRHREAGVLAGVVDVRVRVQDVADVGAVESVLRELRVDPLLLRDEAGHVQSLHDLRVARARVDQDRADRIAEDEHTPGRRDGADPHVAGEHEEAGLELDVDQGEELDLVGRHRGKPPGRSPRGA